MANGLNDLALGLMYAGDLAGAERLYLQAIEMDVALLEYGDTLRIEKKYAEAEAPLRRAAELLAKANGENTGITQRTFGVLVKLDADWGKPAKTPG